MAGWSAGVLFQRIALSVECQSRAGPPGEVVDRQARVEALAARGGAPRRCPGRARSCRRARPRRRPPPRPRRAARVRCSPAVSARLSAA